MSEAAGSWRTPYTPTPGSSTPSPEVGPEEGKGELWDFFWLSLLNTTVIAVVGVVFWLFFRTGAPYAHLLPAGL
jgi:hypothetical protein